MNTGKPLKLISLLKELSQESDKDKMNKKHLEIFEETMKTQFLPIPNYPAIPLWYKKGIQMSTRNYILSDGSEESKSELLEIVSLLENSEVISP